MSNGTARRSQAQRRAETEYRVIAAATALIAEKGSRAVSLAEVGRLAGYSRGIVNHQFETKQKLLAAVVSSAQQFELPFTEDGGLDQLLILVSAYLNNLQRPSPKVRAFLLLWSEALADPTLGPLFDERDSWFRRLLADQVRVGVQDNSIRSDADPEAVAVSLLGLLRGIGMQLVSGNQLPASTKVHDSAVQMLRSGLEPKKPNYAK